MANLLQSTKGFCKRNATTILTSVGAVGVVATAVLAVKATPKALQQLEAAKEEKGEELTKFEMVKVAGPAYIPAVLVGVSTISCVLGADILSRRKRAAIMSAYTMLNSAYSEYKEKVAELYGEDANHTIQQAIANDKYEEQKVEDDGKQLFFDEYSQRFFRATNETILRAEYEINREVTSNFYATINEYYELVGLPKTEHGDHIGWSSAQLYDMYWSDWVDFWHESAVTDDGTEYFIIHMTDPFPDFEDY